MTRDDELRALRREEAELADWLLEADFRDPHYEEKRRRLNFVETSIAIKTAPKREATLSFGLEERSIPRQ